MGKLSCNKGRSSVSGQRSRSNNSIGVQLDGVSKYPHAHYICKNRSSESRIGNHIQYAIFDSNTRLLASLSRYGHYANNKYMSGNNRYRWWRPTQFVSFARPNITFCAPLQDLY